METKKDVGNDKDFSPRIEDGAGVRRVATPERWQAEAPDSSVAKRRAAGAPHSDAARTCPQLAGSESGAPPHCSSVAERRGAFLQPFRGLKPAPNFAASLREAGRSLPTARARGELACVPT